MSGQLEGKIAIVTGGASGIGRAIAELYAREGATVAIADLNLEAGQALARELGSLGGSHSAHAVDVTDEHSTKALAEDVAALHGRIDILVNSAGILTEIPFLEMEPADFDKMIAVDLRSVFLCSRWVAPFMVKQQWGRIINIASQIGLKGGHGLAHYAAAKAGVLGLTKSMARELAADNVLVNAIAPGPIVTPLLGDLSDEWRAEKQAELPLGRFGTAEEVAPSALLLASSPGGNLFMGQTLGPNSGDVMP
ncbi:MAG: 3-oxoacyl-ACP reductase family protein [Paeniglutamicibacter sp.]